MSVKISRILHAGYVFERSGVQIAFDPIFENPFSKNCFAYPDVCFDQETIRSLRFSAIFISHFHDDHCSLQSLDLLDRNTPIYIYCVFDELIELIKELGFIHVFPLKLNEPVGVGPFQVIPRRALDEDVDSIFHIQVDGLNILNVVDSWIDPQVFNLLAKSCWHMVLWPFQTMREIEVLAPRQILPVPAEIPPEWLEQLKVLNPKYLIPSSCQFIFDSWSWYNQAFFPISYRFFSEQVKQHLPQTEILRLNPSVSVLLDEKSLVMTSPLDWVQPVGEQNVDYNYQPHIKPESSSGIAQRFSGLDHAQEKAVLDYCDHGILEKYKSLDESTDIYFHKSRKWRLTIFKFDGAPISFDYILNGSHISKSPASHLEFDWITEISMAKLYGALFCGESLTSIYLRVNDHPYPPEIENHIQAVDVMEDPLIRCLYHGNFAAYQKAQLKKIKQS